MTDPTPLAYGLWNPRSEKILGTVYTQHSRAVASARHPDDSPPFSIIPLYGPGTLATMADNVAMCQRAEAVLRAENIELRNQIAIMRGREVAQAHAWAARATATAAHAAAEGATDND